MRIKSTSILVLAALASACAAPSQPYLDNAQALCHSGDQVSCKELPYWSSVVAQEKNQQAERIAGGILLGIAAAGAGAAAGYAASHPAPVYYAPTVVVCRGYWGC